MAIQKRLAIYSLDSCKEYIKFLIFLLVFYFPDSFLFSHMNNALIYYFFLFISKIMIGKLEPKLNSKKYFGKFKINLINRLEFMK